ncbi:outer membrane protein assembly factor BamA [Rhizobium sp. AG207R]|uniref:outer membrane protein assembly factor BamA n=1 Tax=Rhizobium sp. AG207R TaxID=2802287 RepID=UPI0022AC2E8D|nr:outer membrane protein assembly factor BamA [Rhizobium sp. AG207R]MCZ3374308.1 outer membrane protein assembly factor BamA [Rhizobium sp. AG207R]
MSSKSPQSKAAVPKSLTTILTLSASVALMTTPVHAAVVNSIRVIGAERVGSTAITDNITISARKAFTDTDIDKSTKQLYATGYFSDVKISVSGQTLVISVKENLLINAIVFNGNKKIKDDKLSGIISSHVAGPYNEVQVQADIRSIKDAYVSIGRNDVEVTTKVFNVSKNRVNLAFVVNEGNRTKISKIEFSGNHAFSSGRLAAVISTKKSGLLSFLTRKDLYSDAKKAADEDALRKFYYDHGFVDFRIVSSDATFDSTSNSYAVNFIVDEGVKYKYGDVSLTSTVEGIKAGELEGLVLTRKGDTYNAQNIQKSLDAISKRVEEAGYPFVQVTPRGNRNPEDRSVAVEYLVDQGKRAYVERIDIRGNSRTRDYVIRREFDLNEGDAFNEATLTRAKRRLDALGYFSSVKIATSPGSAPDRVIVVVDVEDQPTGSFGIGGGYAVGNDGGLLLEASVEEKNFLGRGQYIKIAAGAGTSGSQTYNLSFTEPYFLGYRLAAGFDIFKSKNSSSSDYYDYGEEGISLRVTAPITESLATTFRYNLKQITYTGEDDWEDNLSAPYRNLINNGPWIQSTVSQTFTYNTLDDQNLPRDGVIAKLTNELAGLGGDSNFYKISGKARYYHTLSDAQDIIGSFTLGAGYMVSTTGQDLNIFDQFTLGGSEIRGFQNSGIGPRTSDGDALGGTKYFTASAEASMPTPGVPQDIGLRSSVFVDAGTLYGNSANLYGDVLKDGSALRASAGVGLTWASPFGVINVSYAVPFLKQDYDKVENFRFGIGTQF